ncbi:type III pantothenate kinase, partial [Rickettsiales bacterium]|nr:type III pantothenate kinase [Rickettsiales bacterium]
NEVKISANIKIDRPSEVGADRLVNAVAAYKKFGGNVIVIDFGTATTFDVVDENGDYVGGVISPGIDLSIQALQMAAAKLPEVSIIRPEKVIGTSTISAMQSGVYWGYLGLIEGIASRIKKEQAKEMTIIATGGLAGLFYGGSDLIEHCEPDLTIYGLQYIYQQNKKA